MKRARRPETPVDLVLWVEDGGAMISNDPKVRPVDYPRVEIGRTDSKRRLGFEVWMSSTDTAPVLFTLDRVQVERLLAYLTRQLGRLKK